MIINQWVPAAHKGDAIGDSARRVRDLLRAMGHESELYALTIDDDLRHEVRAVQRRRGETRRHHDLPLRAAVADDRGVRLAAVGTRPAVPQRDAGVVLRAVRSGAVPSRGARARRAGDARRPRRSRARRLGVQPARSSRRSASTAPACSRLRSTPRASRSRLRAAGARPHPGRRAGELPVRRAGLRRTRRSRTTSSWPRSTSGTSTPITASSSSAGSTSCRGIIR